MPNSEEPISLDLGRNISNNYDSNIKIPLNQNITLKGYLDVIKIDNNHLIYRFYSDNYEPIDLELDTRDYKDFCLDKN